MRRDYTPRRNPVLGIILGLVLVAALALTITGLFVMTGVLR